MVNFAIADRSRAAREGFDLRGTETSPNLHEIIVTCEAKGLRDDILTDQIKSQIEAAFGQASITQDTAVAVAVKAIGPSQVYVVEFAEVKREEIEAFELKVASEAIYEFLPRIPGIGE